MIDAQEKAEQQAYDKAVQLLDYDVDSAAMKYHWQIVTAL